ncbi:MAG TPA: hypothetical protein VFN47_03375 [Pedococcus sp.]|nr:hypothetical protein [Pedococcus sp.]
MSTPGEGPEQGSGSSTELFQVEDRGSFSHGVCRVCGWSGPGRRSRQRAGADLAGHRSDDCPKGGDTAAG